MLVTYSNPVVTLNFRATHYIIHACMYIRRYYYNENMPYPESNFFISVLFSGRYSYWRTGAVESWVEADVQILHMYFYGKYYMFIVESPAMCPHGTGMRISSTCLATGRVTSRWHCFCSITVPAFCFRRILTIALNIWNIEIAFSAQ